MRSSCVFSLPTSTHVGSAAAALSGAEAASAGDTAMSPMSAAFMTVSPAFAAASFAVPSPASGITPSSITSVRSRHMALRVILLMLFLLLFGFLFLFRHRQLFAADVAVVRVRSCHRTAFRAPRVPRKVPFPIIGNVFLGSSIEFSEEITALLSASPLSSFVLLSPASAESRYSIRCICGTVGTDRLRLGR